MTHDSEKKGLARKNVALPENIDLKPLAISTLLDNSRTDFDLYVKAKEQNQPPWILYANGSYHWTREELQRLLAQGIDTLYYSSADAAKYEAYGRLSKIPKIDMSLAPAQRVLNITDAAAELTRILYDHPLTPASLAVGREIATNLVGTIDEDPSCVQALGKLAHHDYYTYYHSARVAAYGLALALQLSLKETARLESIAIGALLHDVGKSKIDFAILNKQGPLTAEEWVAMRQHPVFGEAIIKDSLLDVIPREIVLHHHEKLDGTGYPHQLSANELLYEVRIAAFADVFDALTTNRPYHSSRTRFEALDFIRTKMLGHLDQDIYKAMVEILRLEEKKKS